MDNDGDDDGKQFVSPVFLNVSELWPKEVKRGDGGLSFDRTCSCCVQCILIRHTRIGKTKMWTMRHEPMFVGFLQSELRLKKFSIQEKNQQPTPEENGQRKRFCAVEFKIKTKMAGGCFHMKFGF